MSKKIIILILVIFYALPVYSLSKELSKYEIVAAAAEALKEQGFDLYRVQIIYDDNNQLWRERISKMSDLANSPNFKLFERGFLKNYRAVFFGFKNPPGEVWVFVDKDTGEVLEVYRPKFVNK